MTGTFEGCCGGMEIATHGAYKTVSLLSDLSSQSDRKIVCQNRNGHYGDAVIGRGVEMIP